MDEQIRTSEVKEYYTNNNGRVMDHSLNGKQAYKDCLEGVFLKWI